MTLSNEITFKLLALVLCDNIYLRIVILAFLIIRVMTKKEFVNKDVNDWLVGSLIVVLNSIFEIDFTIINFIVLGFLSNSLCKLKYSSFLNLYLSCVLARGVAVFWLKI